MALEIIGTLHEVYETKQISETFSKREFVLELNDESPSGMVYTNYATFQVTNNNTALLDQFKKGDRIKVNFNLRGNRWQKPDGEVKYITNLQAWRIEPYQKNSQGAVPQSNSISNQVPTGGTTNNPNPSPAAPSGTDGEDDDLPF